MALRFGNEPVDRMIATEEAFDAVDSGPRDRGSSPRSMT
jgi:hypothetical protein